MSELNENKSAQSVKRTFTSAFKNWLLPNSLPGLLLGVQIALGLLVVALVIATATFSLAPTGSLAVSYLAVALFIFNSASGSFVDLSITGNSLNLETGPLFGAVGLHPTLLTLALILATYAIAKKQGKKLSASSTSTRLVSAASIGLGFTVFAWVVSLFAASSTFVIGGAVTLQPSSLLSLLPIFLVVSVVALSGLTSATTSAFESGFFAWAVRSTFAFFVSFTALIFTVLLIVSIILWIQPDFANSLPEVKADNSFSNYLGLGGLGVAIFLPTILLYVFVIGVGGSLGLTYNLDNATSGVWDAVAGFLPAFNFSNVDVLSLLGFPYEAALLAVVAVVAMTSAVIGHHQTGYVPRKLSHFLGFFAVALGLLVAATFLSDTSFNWTNRGQTASTFTQGAVQLDEGSARAGITLGLLVLVFMIMTAAGFGATKHFRNFLSESYPRLFAYTSGKPVLTDDKRRFSARLFGLETVVVLVLAVAVPTTFVTVERVWASVDTPAALASSFGSQIQNGDVATVKSMLQGDENYPWISDKVLKIAKPKTGWSQNSSAKNLNDRAWEVGNLDAIAFLGWESKNGKVSYELPTTSKLKTYIGFIKHPTFKLQPEPVYVTFANDMFYPADLMAKALLNGEKVQPGTYRSFPGQYHVVAEGYKLIAPTDKWISSTGAELLISVGNEMALPANADEAFTKTADSRAATCNSVDASGNGTCFSVDDVVAAAQITQGTMPTEYFNAANTEYTATGTKCMANGKSWLLSAESVARKVTCVTTVEFLTSYTKSNYAYVQQPIFKSIEISPCDSDEVCEPSYVDKIVGYQSVLQATQGDVFAQTRAKSKISFSFTLIGNLGADNNLVVQ